MATNKQLVSKDEAHAVADTIREQIGIGGFMTLGAHKLQFTDEGNGGLRFNARILPFNVDGERSVEPRIMQVAVILNGNDYYDVAVTYVKRGNIVTHFERSDVDCSSLQRLTLALDFNGETVLNPRYS